MKLMTNRTRLRIDLALAEADKDPTSRSAPGRRQLLAPPATPTVMADRSRPTLVAPERQQSVRLGSSATLDA